MITETGKPTRPTTINLAFLGYLVSTVAALVGAVLVVGARQQFLSALRTADAQSGGRLTETQLQQAVTVFQAVGIGVLVVLAAIYLLLAFRLRAGRNWARVVLTIILALQLISLATVHGTFVSYISAGAALIATVLAYLPASNEYLRPARWR